MSYHTIGLAVDFNTPAYRDFALKVLTDPYDAEQFEPWEVKAFNALDMMTTPDLVVADGRFSLFVVWETISAEPDDIAQYFAEAEGQVQRLYMLGDASQAPDEEGSLYLNQDDGWKILKTGEFKTVSEFGQEDDPRAILKVVKQPLN
ncbi:hypothetical protein [Zooshikella sp. RANM57]|uniref:hypothetical protein n=1 Tax=Zooshikella sp. RANM57 TaxID=3425863 RepID=UPI003D6E233F